jgi:diguanylate cyclase (GGDEF)-like protein
MRPLMWMQPRSRPAAIRGIIILSVVAAVVTVGFTPIQPGGRDLAWAEATLTLLAVGLFVVVCWMTRRRPNAVSAAWALGPLLAVALIIEVDFLTADGSVPAQIFLFFPTLFGASQLRRAGAIVMTVASVVGEVILVFTLLPLQEAIVDTGYVSAALVTTAAVLIHSGERQAELIEKLERLAAIDPLTGLATRRVLDEAAQSALSGAASGDGTSLIVLDVDEFKSINDRHGHPAGDEVLVQLADLLIRSSRRHDVVSRLGGDEMALLLPGCSVENVRRRAEQIVRDVHASRFLLSDGKELTVSVSVGLAHVPTDAVDLRSLYVKADQILYEAKRSGRNRVGGAADDSNVLVPHATP